MAEVEISSLVSEFCAAAIEKGDFASPSKLDRELHARMAKAVAQLRSMGESGAKALEALLKHESPHVRTWIAAELLATGNRSAEPVLCALQTERGLVATNARMVLQEYEAGRLRSPFGTNVA